MGRAILWMVMLLVICGLISLLIGTVIAVAANARDSRARGRWQEQREMERLEQERIEFLRRERGE